MVQNVTLGCAICIETNNQSILDDNVLKINYYLPKVKPKTNDPLKQDIYPIRVNYE